MKRQLYQELQKWKTDQKRKPLIVMGARQVGKTTLLKKFGKTEYSNYLYLNFEEMLGLHSLFEENLSPQVVLKALSIELNQEIFPEKTLIIFDDPGILVKKRV